VRPKTAGWIRDPFLADLNEINDEEDVKETIRLVFQ